MGLLQMACIFGRAKDPRNQFLSPRLVQWVVFFYRIDFLGLGISNSHPSWCTPWSSALLLRYVCLSVETTDIRLRPSWSSPLSGQCAICLDWVSCCGIIHWLSLKKILSRTDTSSQYWPNFDAHFCFSRSLSSLLVDFGVLQIFFNCLSSMAASINWQSKIPTPTPTSVSTFFVEAVGILSPPILP